MSKVVNASRRLTLSLTLSAVAASVLGLAGCFEPKAAFKGVDITGADYAKELNLPDQNGQLRKIKDFSGKLVVVFFGYTQCPDVCPTTMQELAEVKRLLGANGDKLQAVFVTVDPERDTTELLKAYVENFDASFVALRPTPEQLPLIAKEFKIYFKRVEGKTPTSYTMDHSAGSYTFDTQGKVRLFNRYGMGPEALAHDFKLLLK
jgi:protein SCO1/2